MPTITPEMLKTLILIAPFLVGAANLMLIFDIRAGRQPIKKMAALVGAICYISFMWWWLAT